MATPKKAADRTKAAKSTAPTPSPGADPTTDALTDRALVAAWNKLSRKLTALVTEDATRFDARYELVADAMDAETPLYLAGGYRTFEQFCREYLKEDARAVRRNVLVARCADPEEIKQFGAAFLERVIQYLVARKKLVVAKGRSPVAFSKLKIPVERSGNTSLVALPELTWDELDAALRKAASDGDARERAPAVVQAIQRSVKGTSIDHISVSLTGGKLRFGGVPLEWLELFGQKIVQAARAHETLRAEREAREDARDERPRATTEKGAKKAAKKSRR